MISGLLVTHQCETFDYCYKEAIHSLLETCDDVVVVDGKSTDGTREGLASFPIRLIDADWNPIQGTRGQWLADLYNLAKSKAKYTYSIGLQADEVIHEIDRKEIRKWRRNVTVKRLNFWRDHQHYLPNGVVCGSRVFRFGHKSVKFVGDAEGMDPGVKRRDSNVCIFHYGFLRKTESLIQKSISFENEVFGTHNQLFDQMKEEGRKPFDELHQVIPYEGTHPKYAHQWLKDRGYKL